LIGALRIGPLARGALSRPSGGKVVGSHRRAANLLLDDGSLVALLPAVAPLHPWAVTVGFDVGALPEGAAVRVAPPRLSVGPTGFDLSAARPVPLVLRLRPPTFPSRWLARLEERLAAVDSGDGRFDSPLRSLTTPFEKGENPAPLVALVGLGEGLTPSGDDILVGALAGLDLLENVVPGAAALRSLLVSALPPDLEARTPRLSAQMLRAAADRLYAEPLLALLETAGSPAQEPTSEAVSALLALGHRSGHDLLLGLVAAFRRCATSVKIKES
jgi:hypothetical protein